MELSPEQSRALDAVAHWFAAGESQHFYLAGYAGTGKTTLATKFAEGVKGAVLFAAYTGKAAYVMSQKGCPGARTIHKLIYVPKQQSKERAQSLLLELSEEESKATNRERIEELKRELKQEEDNLRRPMFSLNLDSDIRYASLIIVDECSMISGQMVEDLLSFGKRVLFLGDPGQLPPVGDKGYFTERRPDFQLTEIHRQAQDSPIIRLATEARLGRRLQHGTYGSSEVIPWGAVTPEHAMSADQILVGRNATRHNTNRRMRELLGRTHPLPEPTDRLVCLRNNHEIGLLNGSIWITETAEFHEDSDNVVLQLHMEGESERRVTTVSHAGLLKGEEVPFWALDEVDQFNYGYALTVHKSQGSQWDHILLFNESSVFRDQSRKWLYTAITRAAETIRIVT